MEFLRPLTFLIRDVKQVLVTRDENRSPSKKGVIYKGNRVEHMWNSCML